MKTTTLLNSWLLLMGMPCAKSKLMSKYPRERLEYFLNASTYGIFQPALFYAQMSMILLEYLKKPLLAYHLVSIVFVNGNLPFRILLVFTGDWQKAH